MYNQCGYCGKMENSFLILPSGFNRLLVHLWFSLVSGRLRHLYILKPNTETVSGSSGSLHMSARNGSASDADCRISEDIPVPDVELMELGPLLEEGGGRPEVGLLFWWVSVIRVICHCSSSLLFNFFKKGALMLSDEEEEDDEVEEVLTLPLQAHRAMEKMEEFVHKVNRFFPLLINILDQTKGCHLKPAWIFHYTMSRWLPVGIRCDTQLQIYVDKSNSRLNHDCCTVWVIMEVQFSLGHAQVLMGKCQRHCSSINAS